MFYSLILTSSRVKQNVNSYYVTTICKPDMGTVPVPETVHVKLRYIYGKSP